MAGQSLHRIYEGSEDMGEWAGNERLQGGVFVYHVSLRLCDSTASNKAIPRKMDCRQPDRFAAVVSHVLGSIPIFFNVALR